MKLYATTTSERASKGQGGNKFLEIKVQDELQKTIATINVVPLETCLSFSVQMEDKDWSISTSKRSFDDPFSFSGILSKKGNKQKGDHTKCTLSCNTCGGCLDCGHQCP